MTDNVSDRALVISEEEGLRSGLTFGHVQRAEKYGGGFFVNVEGLHHLHCLVSLPPCQFEEVPPRWKSESANMLQDLLRKSLYYNYPYYKALGKHAFQNDNDILQLHVCEWSTLIHGTDVPI